MYAKRGYGGCSKSFECANCMSSAAGNHADSQGGSKAPVYMQGVARGVLLALQMLYDFQECIWWPRSVLV